MAESETMKIKGNERDLATLMLFAFRYAVNRLPTQSTDAIYNMLVDNIGVLEDFMLEQMQQELERNFQIMEWKKMESKRISYVDDCEFQRPLLDAIKKEIERREEEKHGRQTNPAI